MGFMIALFTGHGQFDKAFSTKNLTTTSMILLYHTIFAFSTFYSHIDFYFMSMLFPMLPRRSADLTAKVLEEYLAEHERAE